MDFKLRLKALARLTNSKSEAAALALRKEFDQLSTTLLTSDRVEMLDRALMVAEVIGYRFSAQTAGLLQTFLRSIESRPLRRDDATEALVEERYHEHDALLARALAIL